MKDSPEYEWHPSGKTADAGWWTMKNERIPYERTSMIGWTEEKWIEVFDRWLERTARYERALQTISAGGNGRNSSVEIARKALEDE